MITVDRIEGEWAVLCLPDETTCTVQLCELPPDVQAGDVVIKTLQGFCVDAVATASLRERARRLRRNV